MQHHSSNVYVSGILLEVKFGLIEHFDVLTEAAAVDSMSEAVALETSLIALD